MRKVIITGEGIDRLQLTEAEDPSPGRFDVLIEMRATSLNYRDLLTVKTGAGGNAGLVPKSCGAGTVVATGSEVSRLEVGDRVAPMFFQKWLAGPPTPEGLGSALGGPIDGCLRDRMALHEEGVTRSPDYLSFDEAATVPCAARTAWRALVEEGDLRAGETVLVQGTGGVSVFALQFAKMLGAEVIITSSSDEKLELAQRLGADHAINYRSEPDWAKAARRLTNGRGVDHVVEVGGADTLQQSIASVALGGHIHLICDLSGFVNDVNVDEVFATNARLHGITVGSRLMFENMIRAMALHETHPIIDRTLDITECREAFSLMERGGHFGKIVVTH